MERLDALQLFVAVADHSGFAAGARALGVSPASATRAVNALEASLGVRLFTRTTRSVRLTELGHAYLGRVRQVLDDLGQADALASGAATVPSGRLRITGPVRFGVLHLMPVLSTFLQTHPTVTADAVLVDRVVNLIDEGFDTALRIGPLPDTGLIARRVGEVRRVVCAAPNYLEAHGTPKTPGDLAKHRIVAAAAVTPTEDWRFRGGRTVRVTPRFTVNAVEAAIEMARLGLGLTYVLSYQVAAAVAAGELEVLLAEYEPEPIPVQLIHAEGRTASAKLRAFLDHASPLLTARLRQPGDG